MGFLGIMLVAAAITTSARGQNSMTFAWNPSSDSGVAGYHLYEGGACRTYTNMISLGKMTNATVAGLASGCTYFFAVTTYDTNGLESDFSTELSYSFSLPTNPPPTIALTAPVNGASYAAPAAIPLAAAVTANGHTIAKVQFYNGATLLAEDSSAPYTATWTNIGAGSYSLTARAVYDSGSAVSSAPANLTVTGLPAPWQAADIGSVGVAGSATISGGLYAVAGAGQINGSADSFRFLYQTMSGDGKIDARVSSAQNTGKTGSVGVMIRESLTSGSEYAFMGISPDGTFRWQRRSNTGHTTASTTSGAGTPPKAWARLVRTNGILYGYQSTNGITWTLVNSHSITMATNIYIGLAVASGTSAVLNSTTFTNVTVVP
jgi:hypothetical protein